MRTLNTYREDIQGLRALAVFLVVIGHFFPSYFPGGFIGVDIFFVISGFVITRQLVNLQENSPHHFVRNFYLRRIRRIFPSALLVLLATYFAVFLMLGIVATNELSLDSFWATLFLSNVHFQHTGTNYFAAGMAPSPIQHYWSLAVEEQFYLFLPLLFLIFTKRSMPRRVQILIVSGSSIVSLIWCIYLNVFYSLPIFFQTLPRVWELGIGVVVALSRYQRSLANRQIYLLLFAVIGYGIFAPLRESWPNLLAIPLIMFTVRILINPSRGKTRNFLTLKPITFLGDISFLLYLIHWPLINIAEQMHQNLGNSWRIAILCGAVFLATALHFLFEKPLRNSSWFLEKPKISFLVTFTIVFLCAFFFWTHHQG